MGEPLAGFFLLCHCFVMEHLLRVIAVVRQRCARVGLSRFVDLLRAIVQSLIVECRFTCTVLILSVMCCRPPCAWTFNGLRERRVQISLHLSRRLSCGYLTLQLPRELRSGRRLFDYRLSRSIRGSPTVGLDTDLAEQVFDLTIEMLTRILQLMDEAGVLRD